MKKVIRITMLTFIFSMLLTACGVAVENQTDMMQLYDKVFTGVLWWIILGGLGIGALVGFAISAKFDGCGAGIVIIIVSVAMHALIGYLGTAPSKADNAVTVAWEAAKDDQARYREKIHGYWVAYDEEIHECSVSYSSKADTGCEYVTESCTEDEDGNKDCDYYPWFDYERTLTGVLFDNWKNLDVQFAYHLAPSDWQNNQRTGLFGTGGVPWGKHAGVDFQYEDPEPWANIKTAIDAGVVLPGSRYNEYFNWQHANDKDLYIQYGGNIPAFEAADILPTINPLYDKYEYDVVQFSSAITMSDQEYAAWQQTGHLLVGQAGRQVQASLILYFAKASQVDDTYAWNNTSKAYLQDESVHGQDMLPKNMVLVTCVVSDDLSTIIECRLETGMFEGNNGLKDNVYEVRDIPFTPEAVFGQVEAAFAVNGDGSLVEDENGWLIPEVTISGEASIGRLILDYFVRIEMETKEYLRAGIKPTQEQQKSIYKAEVAAVIKSLLLIYSVILSGLGGLFKES